MDIIKPESKGIAIIMRDKKIHFNPEFIPLCIVSTKKQFHS